MSEQTTYERLDAMLDALIEAAAEIGSAMSVARMEEAVGEANAIKRAILDAWNAFEV